MNMTLFQIGAAIVMVVVIGALFIWFLRDLEANSESRMMRMLKRAGVDPEIAVQGNTEAIIEDVRSRCRKCRVEDVCERWLAGEVKGENSFCPNARIFSNLAKTAGHTA